MCGSRPAKNETRIVSIGYLNWLYRDFQGHDRYYAYLHARRIPGLMCIHSHEGAWNAYNPAGYYGGLQMDWSFMRTYGWDMLRKYHWRDARYWSPTDQLAVASRAVAHRGYWPWYNSAAACGLIRWLTGRSPVIWVRPGGDSHRPAAFPALKRIPRDSDTRWDVLGFPFAGAARPVPRAVVQPRAARGAACVHDASDRADRRLGHVDLRLGSRP